MKCNRCKDTGSIQEARQCVPCPECQPGWIQDAAAAVVDELEVGCVERVASLIESAWLDGKERGERV